MNGTVALVTGASSGIGAALARELARRGVYVALAARRLERLTELAEEIRARGGRALAVACDVTRDGDPERAVAAAVAEWGRLDTVVANAGFGVSGELRELSLDDYRRQFETNVLGLIRTVKAALAEIEKTRGRVVLLGSVMGHISRPGASAYAMSKFAVRALAWSLREELRRTGVSVTHVAPGLVESEFRLKDRAGQLRPGAKDEAPAWLIMPTGKAARQIAHAIKRRRKEAVITLHGKLLVLVARFGPWLATLAQAVGRRGQHAGSDE